MAKQSKPHKETVERVMHEFKHGDLKQRGGRKVRNPKQAIAIALSEAGASNQDSPQKNKENLRKTKAEERTGRNTAKPKGGKAAGVERSKAELYAEAKKRDIHGRSSMDKPDLERALRG